MPPARPREERFWDKVDQTGPIPIHCPELGPCWLWTGALDHQGYGTFTWQGRGEGGLVWIGAHRAAFLLDGGRLAPGEQALHRCDNPPCVRRSHLFAGTIADNQRDSYAKGRSGLFKYNESRRKVA
jgi:hypothetical protein